MAKTLSTGFSQVPENKKSDRRKPGGKWKYALAAIVAVALIGGIFGGKGGGSADGSLDRTGPTEPSTEVSAVVPTEDPIYQAPSPEPEVPSDPAESEIATDDAAESDDPGDVDDDEILPPEETEEPEIVNPLDQDLQSARVKGTKVTRGYISVSPEGLEAITSEQLVAFATEKVKDSGYNWVSIISTDGRGIVFEGSQIDAPSIGILDDEGRIETASAYLRLRDGQYVYAESEPPTGDNEAAGQATETMPVTTPEPPVDTTPPPSTANTEFVLNTSTMKYHRPSCSWLPTDNRLDSHDKTATELEAAGYVPCKRCNPR